MISYLYLFSSPVSNLLFKALGWWFGPPYFLSCEDPFPLFLRYLVTTPSAVLSILSAQNLLSVILYPNGGDFPPFHSQNKAGN